MSNVLFHIYAGCLEAREYILHGPPRGLQPSIACSEVYLRFTVLTHLPQTYTFKLKRDSPNDARLDLKCSALMRPLCPKGLTDRLLFITLLLLFKFKIKGKEINDIMAEI